VNNQLNDHGHLAVPPVLEEEEEEEEVFIPSENDKEEVGKLVQEHE